VGKGYNKGTAMTDTDPERLQDKIGLKLGPCKTCSLMADSPYLIGRRAGAGRKQFVVEVRYCPVCGRYLVGDRYDR
jgi:hypothetical protein